jgi:hypothetical protein
MEAVANYFRIHEFYRFAAIITNQTELTNELSLLRTMKGAIQNRVVEIAGRTLCKEVKMIFQSSDRANAQIREAFKDFDVFRGSKRIPSECYFMPKSAAEPALEVADFIMHAAGRQARHNLTNKGSFLPDFDAVFRAVDRKFTSFIQIESVKLN